MPAEYQPATVRCVVARPDAPEHLDLAFDHAGKTTRLRLSRRDVRWLVEAIRADYLSRSTLDQSPIGEVN